MTESRGTQSPKSWAHIIEYDYNAPASVFSKKQIDYIEGIAAYLTPDEVAKVRQIEWLMFNTNANAPDYSFLPGLRGGADIDGDEDGALYVKRFSSASYAKMMDLFFLGHVPEDFPKTGSGGNMPGYRVTLPNGDRFYPIAFFGDLAAWRKRLQESADLHHTVLGQFENGKFVVAGGQHFAFGDLHVDLLEARRYPKSW